MYISEVSRAAAKTEEMRKKLVENFGGSVARVYFSVGDAAKKKSKRASG